MQEKKSLEKILKFFSIIKYNKKDYIFYFFQSIIRWFNPLIHIFFIERIVFCLTQNNFELLNHTLIFYVITLVIYEILWFLTRKIWWVIALPRNESFIYEKYLTSFVKMDNNEVEKIWIWKIIAILENWRLRWAEWVVKVIEKWIPLIILGIYVFFVTFKHGFIYTLLFFILICISVFILVLVNARQFGFRKKRAELRNDRLRLITKILMSKNEVLQTGKIKSEIEKLDKYTYWMLDINVQMATGRTIQNRAIPFWIWISLFIFSLIFSRFVLSGEMSVSSFVWFTSIFLVINSSISNFINFYVDLTKDFVDIEKLWDFFENTKTLEWYEEWKDFVYKNWDIEFKNISYSYNDNDKIFDNFYLNITWKKITALVWNSWSWKTTLVKLLAWYIRQKSWEIYVDWQDLTKTSLKSYYKNIWYLTQEPSIFDWSIIENLTYAIDREVLDEEIKKVIKDAKCEFIYKLKDWINTQIWERGVRLSGWQKQRLAIAKIMLKNPNIIILDEPTSALDSFSEEQITKALNNLFNNKTVIIIAHRLQTVKNADKIIVLEDWKIVESWTHDSLIEKKWVYKKMLDLQSGF